MATSPGYGASGPDGSTSTAYTSCWWGPAQSTTCAPARSSGASVRNVSVSKHCPTASADGVSCGAPADDVVVPPPALPNGSSGRVVVVAPRLCPPVQATHATAHTTTDANRARRTSEVRGEQAREVLEEEEERHEEERQADGVGHPLAPATPDPPRREPDGGAQQTEEEHGQLRRPLAPEPEVELLRLLAGCGRQRVALQHRGDDDALRGAVLGMARGERQAVVVEVAEDLDRARRHDGVR